MKVLKQIGRVLLILIAVLVILGSVAGVAGAWWANRVVTNATMQVFAVTEQAVTLAQAGVSQVNSLIDQGRTEVQQAEDTINMVGSNLQANSPVLTALSNRLETRLAPTVTRVQDVLSPVRGAFAAVRLAVDIATAIPGMSQRNPNLAKLDEALTQIDQTAADVRQLGDTLRASVVEGKNQLTQEAVTTLTGLTTRIDDRLGQAQSAVQTAQSDLEAFQVEMNATKSRLLLIYDLAALGMTLLMLWIIYSQVVVIRHHWRGLRGADGSTATALGPVTPPAAVVEPAPPAEEPPLSVEGLPNQPEEASALDEPLPGSAA